jgi:hypothetical protein
MARAGAIVKVSYGRPTGAVVPVSGVIDRQTIARNVRNAVACCDAEHAMG